MPDKYRKILVKRIGQAKDNIGWTALQRAGINPKTVSNWLHEEKPTTPGMDKIEALADLLGLSLSEFFADVDPPPPPKVTPEMALKKIIECFEKHKDEMGDC